MFLQQDGVFFLLATQLLLSFALLHWILLYARMGIYAWGCVKGLDVENARKKWNEDMKDLDRRD